MPSFHSTLKFLGWKHKAIQPFFFFTGRDEVPVLHPLLQTQFPSSLFPSSASGEKRRSSWFHIRLICTKWNSPAVYLKHQLIPHLSVFFKQTYRLLPSPGEKKHWHLNRSEWMSRKSSCISNSKSELKSTHLSIIQKKTSKQPTRETTQILKQSESKGTTWKTSGKSVRPFKGTQYFLREESLTPYPGVFQSPCSQARSQSLQNLTTAQARWFPRCFQPPSEGIFLNRTEKLSGYPLVARSCKNSVQKITEKYPKEKRKSKT